VSAARSVRLDAPDPAQPEAFYKAAFGPDVPVAVRAGEAPTSGFRGYTLSVVVPGPREVDAVVASALDAGATVVKPVAKSFWGYGGVVQAPDGAIWTVASSSKKDTGPATSPVVDRVVLLLGVTDVKAAKQFYVDRGLVVARSFGSKYVEFAASGGAVTLALQSRRALAKNAGVDADGTGSHRIAVVGDAGSFTDPDGFTWETPA
jgi:predicted lactoylglutathione lyase